MKKTTFLFALAIFLSAHSSAQRTTKTYLDLMVNVASTNFNYGSSNSALADYKKPVKGIQAGASFQAGITPVLSLVSEIYYMRKGGGLAEGNQLSTSATTLRLNTLELPVLARIHAGKFYVDAGPSIAYAFSGKRTGDGKSAAVAFDHSAEGFKHFDAGLQAGAGFEFPLKQKRLALDVRYNHGLTNISRNSEMYNRGIMVSVYFSKPWRTNPLAKAAHRDNGE